MKKFTMWAVSALMLLSAQSAFADDLYIGGSVGLSIPQVRFGSHNTGTGEHHHTIGGATSFLGGGLVGIDYTWCDLFCSSLYTALEANVRYNSYGRDTARHTDLLGASNFRVHTTTNLQYGLDLKIGIPVDCCGTTPYALIGVEAARFKTKLHNDSTVAVRGIAPGSSRTFSKTRSGPTVGAGVRFRVWECVDADLQYSYTWYGRHSITATDSTAVGTLPPVVSNWNHKARLEENRVLLSLSFPLWDLSSFF